MKILFPALHYPPVIGGIERWTKEIAERVADKANVFVVTGRVKEEPCKQEQGALRIFRGSLFCLGNLSHSPWWYSLHLLPFIYFKSAKIIKKEKIDILHCNGFLSGWLGYKLKKRFGLPYVITIQSLQQSKPLQKSKKRVYASADVCIAASQAIADYFKQIDVKPEKIKIIPNGIDISRFQGINKQKARQALGLSNNDFVVITVGRLDKRKGIEYLIKAADNFQFPISPEGVAMRPYGAGNFQLLIIGDGPERNNLKELSQRLGLQNKVKFLGEASNKDIPQYLAAADCFCLPSIEEGFGIVILEAIAAGLPVIASRVGGVLDIIKNEQFGFLVNPKDSRAIAKALLDIYRNPESAKARAENAKVILPIYDWHNIAEQVYQIYHKTANSSRQP